MAVPRSAFPLPPSGWGRHDEVLHYDRCPTGGGGGGGERGGRGRGCARDPSRRRIGDAALSLAARWRVVDRRGRAARGCRAVGAGDGRGTGGSRSPGRTKPRDRGGQREEPTRRSWGDGARADARPGGDRKSTRLNSSHGYISYAV